MNYSHKEKQSVLLADLGQAEPDSCEMGVKSAQCEADSSPHCHSDLGLDKHFTPAQEMGLSPDPVGAGDFGWKN